MSAEAVRGIVWDLDGLLLDTETICTQIAQEVLARHGKVLTPEAHAAALGKRPVESWAAVVSSVGLEGVVTAEELVAVSEPLLAVRWGGAQLMPGAARLLRHLQAAGLPQALATSTSRASLHRKTAHMPWLMEAFGDAVVCGDEVAQGKPAPDVFLAAAQKLGVPPQACLVFEDAPSGAQAATAAGMRVVVVPSTDASDFPTPDATAAAGIVQLLPSLLAFSPAALGLPPFRDTVAGVVPVVDPPLRIRGTVVKGFGRGSKELGIPTANVDMAAVRTCLASAVTGIYAGWASVGESPEVYVMCMSIGHNPVFANKEKTAEAWVLHTFPEDFYGAEIRLVVCGFIRPESNFESVAALVARIHQDAADTRQALQAPQLERLRQDPWLRPAHLALN